jgi:hypothetical protein
VQLPYPLSIIHSDYKIQESHPNPEALRKESVSFAKTSRSHSDIHPLVWRPETFGLAHQLCRSNRAEVAKPKRDTETEDESVRHL